MNDVLLMNREIFAHFLIYLEAIPHIWLCNCSTLNFLIYEKNLIYLFLSVHAPAPAPLEQWRQFLPVLLGVGAVQCTLGASIVYFFGISKIFKHGMKDFGYISCIFWLRFIIMLLYLTFRLQCVDTCLYNECALNTDDPELSFLS